jgi:two-component system, OmpR family, sensor histidine kinase KdpD
MPHDNPASRVAWCSAEAQDQTSMAGGTFIYAELPTRPESANKPLRSGVRAVVASVASTAICTGLGLLAKSYLPPVGLETLIYLVGVLAVASRLPLLEALGAATFHAAVFNYLFIPPQLAFVWPDAEGAVTLVTMIVVAAALASSQQRTRAQEQQALFRAHVASTMYLLARELGSSTSLEQIAFVTSRNVERMLGGRAWVVPASSDGPPEPTSSVLLEHAGVIEEAWSGLEPALRRNGKALTSAGVAMLGTRKVVGVLVVEAPGTLSIGETEAVMLLEHCAQQAAAALEKVTLEQETRRAELAFEAERMRNSLLSAVSHDVRTPLAAIRAAGEMLGARSEQGSSAQSAELAGIVVRESERLLRLVENILSLTRVETGGLALQRQETAVEDLVASALRQVAVESIDREIDVQLPEDLRFASVDPMLMGQVLVNVLDNAFKYSSPGSALKLVAENAGDLIELRVLDSGPGFLQHEETRLLEKFVRGSAASAVEGGLGLGLSICRAILLAHGGAIRLGNRSDGPGAVVTIRMPAGREATAPDERRLTS